MKISIELSCEASKEIKKIISCLDINCKKEDFLSKVIEDYAMNINISSGGIYYSKKNDEFFKTNNDELISFTNIEKKVLLYLCKNKNKIVTAEDIAKNCWENGTTVQAVRNKIKAIRTKTSYELIASFSKKGYLVN